MGRLLVHVTHGPEAPTRAALGLLVAKAAIDEGHDVDVFLAGDAVQLMRDAVLDALFAQDPYSRVAGRASRIGWGAAPGFRFGVPKAGQLEFFGNAAYASLFAAS